jgi:hypothetical protein
MTNTNVIGCHKTQGAYFQIRIMNGLDKVYYTKQDFTKAQVLVAKHAMTVLIGNQVFAKIPLLIGWQVYICNEMKDDLFMLPVDEGEETCFNIEETTSIDGMISNNGMLSVVSSSK